MKVLYVTPWYPPDRGGVERHVERLATGMARLGHDVEVLSQSRGDSPVEEASHGVRISRYRARGSGVYVVSPGLAVALRRRRQDFDLVHAHLYHAPPALAAALLGPPTLVFTPHYHGTGHSMIRTALQVPYRLPGRLIFNRAQSVICVSESEARLVEQHFPGARGCIEVIPNGVDRHPRPSRAEPGSDRRTILCVSRLESYKRIDRVIDALPFLSPEIVLEVVGAGPAESKLRALAVNRGVSARVSFLGSLSDAELDRTLAQAEAVVSMSESEAFGLTVAEALAAGKPVVASDIPAHREILESAGSEATRLVARSACPEVVAGAIREAVSAEPLDPEGVDLPTWGEVCERTAALYHVVLEGPAGASARVAS